MDSSPRGVDTNIRIGKGVDFSPPRVPCKVIGRLFARLSGTKWVAHPLESHDLSSY